MPGFTKSFQTIRKKSKSAIKYFEVSAVLKEVMDNLFLNLFGNNEANAS